MELKLEFEGFKGHILMKVATNTDRFELMDHLGINIMDTIKSQDGDGEGGNALQQKLSTMANLVKLIKTSEKFYKEVDLKKGTRTYKSYDDLNNSSDCQSILMECATKCLLNIGDEEGKK